ncbi:Protein kinase protein with adenine nucleotide alpha hydrolases-like domain [Striga hermonthica]|uniref:RING-type E3 ubiquitin transferase n=1 Tax=Striga hermonthica TaxID=68872 RepID=A0A9N7R5L9_STRHE|nr:Protein kinase protein with adenine nucleotide alpha hydrolases-like domain [Striga hermonthica]
MSNFDQNPPQESRIIIPTAVAIDKDKNSQFAVKWAIDKLRLKDKQIILVHVRTHYSLDSSAPKEGREPTQAETQQLFLPYRSFCARKGIRAKEVILQDHDVARGLAEYISISSITTIVLGSSSRGAIVRAFKNADVPSSVGKYAPDCCTVFVVSKGKVVKLKSGSNPETPSSTTSSMPRNAFSPADNISSQSSYNPPDSWKSPASELSSFDSENQTRRTPDEIKNTIPLYNSYGSKSPSPYDSENTSYREYTSCLSNYSSFINSGPSETEFSHTTNKQADNKISNVSQPMSKMSLEVRTRGTRGYSMSESSDLSDIMSFPSDVSFEVMDPQPVSDSSGSSTSSQTAVEVLSRMRHPNMVVLLGACPDYGSLVYEYMENGSLEDRLYRKNGTPPLPWPARFRIAAEIATALNFLHKTRPEPLVHRDLKPANILLDRNFVSKISDVGLCRLVPAPVADSITQCHMTAAAGTFCYIDPEYQQTGMLGTKSDVYSFGVMLLQILTARPAMGLSHHVETAIESGQFADVLDRAVGDWPVEEALSLAKLALKCCELRRRDRPDLDSVILTELERLRDVGLEVSRGVSFFYAHSSQGDGSSKDSSSSSQANQERFYYVNSSSSQVKREVSCAIFISFFFLVFSRNVML